MRTIAIANQKGGCGKTTTAINLAATLARRSRRVLLIDMDPQSHCAAGLGVPEARVERGIGDVLLGNLDQPINEREFLWEVSRNLHLAPSTVSLAALEAAGGGLSGLADRDRRLARLLTWLAPRFDLAIIDCPPTIGLLTFNALRAADEVIVPVETGFFSFRGAEKQIATIHKVVEKLGRPLPFRLLATLYHESRTVDRDVLTALREKYGDAVLPVVVRDHEVLREAASLGQAITEYAPNSSAGSDFDALAEWLLSHPPEVLVARDGPVPTPLVAQAPAPVSFPLAPAAKRASWQTGNIASIAAVSAAAGSVRDALPSADVTGGGRAAELVRRVRELTVRPSPDELSMLRGDDPPTDDLAAPPVDPMNPWPTNSQSVNRWQRGQS
ncbi:MAG: ParA family protein [Phycisphaerae bacterium]|nr:ParA family protein [Phycisphaerae bacterium]